MGGTSPHGAITTILYTNEIGASYDADGNALVNGLLTVYDYENRLGGGVTAAYDRDNKRVWGGVSGTAQVDFYATRPNPNGREMSGAYYRDASGLDYADQRYYSNTGRFVTPNPYRGSGGAADPQSWNRYAYVQDDPVNFNDPTGLFRCLA